MFLREKLLLIAMQRSTLACASYSSQCAADLKASGPFATENHPPRIISTVHAFYRDLLSLFSVHDCFGTEGSSLIMQVTLLRARRAENCSIRSLNIGLRIAAKEGGSLCKVAIARFEDWQLPL